jgi:hypothetical protein
MPIASAENGRTVQLSSAEEGAPDREAAAVAAVMGASRIAIGIGLALAPTSMLRALGFRAESPATTVIARIAGGRDVVMGVTTLLALGNRDRLAAASLANAAADAGDAATFAAALRAGGPLRLAGLRGVAAAAPASLAGLWVAWRCAAGPRPGESR